MIKASVRQYEAMALDPQFDPDMKFKLIESDPVTGKPVMRLMEIIAPTKDLSTILLSSKAGADDRSLVVKLTDLLERCLSLDPAKRMKVSDALKHSLFHSAPTPFPAAATAGGGG
jgi:serine/threonine-protein kinase PRP4